LLAYADPENNASNRVLEKAGFQKGDVRKGFYERAMHSGAKKSDLQSYYMDRLEDYALSGNQQPPRGEN
jgi:ribosomal-protein-alanine N-acetyltransferase